MKQVTALNQELCRLLDGVTDQATARTAKEQIQQQLGSFETALRGTTAGFLHLSDADRDRVMQQLNQSPLPEHADIFEAGARALKGPGANEIRPVLRQLTNIYVDVYPSRHAKQTVRKQIKKMGL